MTNRYPPFELGHDFDQFDIIVWVAHANNDNHDDHKLSDVIIIIAYSHIFTNSDPSYEMTLLISLSLMLVASHGCLSVMMVRTWTTMDNAQFYTRLMIRWQGSHCSALL